MRARKSRKTTTRVFGTMAAALLLATAGCAPSPKADPNATRVLQAVNVKLDGDGAISAVDGSAVYLDAATGATRSEVTSYNTQDVVGDLPLRITTTYRTAEGAGSNLDDLAGYTGRVEIDVQLENLTVAPTVLTYDEAGRSHSVPALVGTPLSVAAATTLPDLDPSAVLLGDDGRGTSGVVSTTPDGGTVVQWAALLAPPQTEATTKFTLVANVTDFQVPVIDVALQAGLHTDLSFEGVVTSAFDANGTSELALQRRSIDLVADVNDVLNRAGTTITEVRTTLEDTSQTLGQNAAARLADSSEALTVEMESIGQQLSSLGAALSASVADTQSAMTVQLSQIVGSMTSMLGDTGARPPVLSTGEGCGATPVESDVPQTTYGMFLRLSGQLNAYADATDSCKNEILTEMTRALGPETPSDTTCIGGAEGSMTCALYQAKHTVFTSTQELLNAGTELIEGLNGVAISEAQNKNAELQVKIADLHDAIDALEASDAPSQIITELNNVRDYAAGALAQMPAIDNIVDVKNSALASLVPAEQVFPQYKDLADEVCGLVEEGQLAQDQADVLLGKIISPTWCTDSLDPAITEAPPVSPGSLEETRRQQIEYWNTVGGLVDSDSDDSLVHQLEQVLTEITNQVNAVLDLASTANEHSEAMQTQIDSLQTLVGEAVNLSRDVDSQLVEVSLQQAALEDAIRGGFEDSADEINASVEQDIDSHVRRVTTTVHLGSAQIASSFTTTIDQLRSTSISMLDDAKASTEAQKDTLNATEAAAVQALSERTEMALSGINEATSGATTDVEAASALLTDSLTRVVLDLGDPQVQGSGILGAMSASAAKSGTADYQLALASQEASGFANIRSEDIDGLLLRRAQFEAAVGSVADFPPFHLEIPAGASSETIYSFQLGGDK